MTIPSPESFNYTRNPYQDYIPGISYDKIVKGELSQTQKIQLANFLKDHPEKEKAFFKTQGLEIFTQHANDAMKVKLVDDFIQFKQTRSFRSLKYADAALSQKTTPQQLANLFKLSGDKKSFNEKISLLQNMIDKNKTEGSLKEAIGNLSSQAKMPLIAEAIQQISDTYSQEPIDPYKLEIQHRNLSILLKWCARAENNAKIILMDKHNLQILEKYFNGDTALEPEFLDELNYPIIKTENSPSHKDKPTIHVSSIKAQIEITQTFKKTKEQLGTKAEIPAIGGSLGGDVFQITEDLPPTKPRPATFAEKVGNLLGITKLPEPIQPPKTTVGFIKVSKNPDENASRYELIAFAIADSLGLANQFAATKAVSIKGKNEEVVEHKGLDTIIKSVLKLDKQSKNVQKASFQAPLEGHLLAEYVDDLRHWNEISHGQLTRAILTASILGNYDLHLNNLIMTREGIKFFDNTRSMPNGQGFVRHGTMVLPTTRNALIIHPDSSKKYTPAQIEELKLRIQQLKRYAEKDMMGLVNSQMFQEEVEKLPKHWLDIKKSSALILQRINAIEKGLNEGKITCASDIMIVADPTVKFSALALMLEPSWAQYLGRGAIDQQDLFADAGMYSLEALVVFCKEKRIDPYKLLELSKREDLSFSQMLQELSKMYKNVVNKTLLPEEKTENDMKCTRFYNQIVEALEVDLKDSLKSFEANVAAMIADHCRRYQIPCYRYENVNDIRHEKAREQAIERNKGIEKAIETLAPFECLVVITNESEGKIVVYRRTEDGFIEEKGANIIEEPGKMRFAGEGEVQTIDEFKRENSPPYYFGKLVQNQVDAIVAKASENSWLLYLNEKNQLVLVQKAPEGKHVVHELLPTENPRVFRSALNNDPFNVYDLQKDYQMLTRP